MIRPMIEAIYDYRMNFSQQRDPNLRSNYKLPYLQACALVGAEGMLAQLQQNNLQNLIADWNSKHRQLSTDKREPTSKTDYKNKLDDIFKNNTKAYYLNRDQDTRPFPRQKSEDYPDSLRPHSLSKARDYSYSHSSQKHDPTHHKSEYVYTSKYRTERH